ncbi:GIP, partial [Symbiodinium necroappetens]
MEVNLRDQEDRTESREYPTELVKRAVRFIHGRLQQRNQDLLREWVCVGDHEERGNGGGDVAAGNGEGERAGERAEEEEEVGPDDDVEVGPEERARIMTMLKKIHSSTGHCSVKHLVQTLKRQGASRQVLKVARQFTCDVCKEWSSPSPRHVASLRPISKKWETLLLDCGYWRNPVTNQTWLFILAVDEGSRLRVGKLIREGSRAKITTEDVDCFLEDKWFSLFGQPSVIRTDAESPLRSQAFDEKLQKRSIGIDHVPPEAHWQMSPVERGIQSTKEIMWKLHAEFPDMTPQDPRSIGDHELLDLPILTEAGVSAEHGHHVEAMRVAESARFGVCVAQGGREEAWNELVDPRKNIPWTIHQILADSKHRVFDDATAEANEMPDEPDAAEEPQPMLRQGLDGPQAHKSRNEEARVLERRPEHALSPSAYWDSEDALVQLEVELPSWESKQRKEMMRDMSAFIAKQLRKNAHELTIQQEKDGFTLYQGHFLDEVNEINIPQARYQEPSLLINENEKHQMRSVLGCLSWYTYQTGYHLSGPVGVMLSKVNRATVQDLVETNKLLKKAKSMRQHRVRIHKMEGPLHLACWVDASHANRPDLSSTKGIFVGWTDSKLLEGQLSQVTPISWISSKIHRVCRSPASAETRAAVDGEDELYAIRLQAAEFQGKVVNVRNVDATIREISSSLISDSKCLYDRLQQTALTLKGEEKRSDIESLCLKEAMDHSSLQVRWVHGDAQLANSLTKDNEYHQILLYQSLQ